MPVWVEIALAVALPAWAISLGVAWYHQSRAIAKLRADMERFRPPRRC